MLRIMQAQGAFYSFVVHILVDKALGYDHLPIMHP